DASSSSQDSGGSTTDFYARAGLQRPDRTGSADEDEDDARSVSPGPDEAEVDRRGVEDDADDLGSVDGRESDCELQDGVVEMVENVEKDEDFLMDYEYEFEGFSRL
ncbi:hypothetical protein C8T65DRAFT_702897, partial [Cerioporus squamosus]